MEETNEKVAIDFGITKTNNQPWNGLDWYNIDPQEGSLGIEKSHPDEGKGGSTQDW